MTTLDDIDQLATRYAAERAALATLVQDLEAQIEQAKRRALPRIRRTVASTAYAHDQLRAALEGAPELFNKPRTRVFAGVKVGYTKQRGKVVITDEEAVIARIRKLLPEDQVALLIRTKESVDKQIAVTLTVADLKRLGISVTDDEDVVVIKPTDSEIDKLVDALLGDAEEIKESAA